jgi:hypothetical protein
VIEITSGYRASQLASGGADESQRPHREFIAKWPRERMPRGTP